MTLMFFRPSFAGAIKRSGAPCSTEQKDPSIFAQRFSRSYRLLHLIACRVLGDEERVPLAINREPAPVTMTTLPSNLFMIFSEKSRHWRCPAQPR